MQNEIITKVNFENVCLGIANVAKMFKLNQRTLRIYDEENILRCARTDGNRRYYTYSDIEKIKVIMFLTSNLGLNLIGVKVVFAIFEKMNIKNKKQLYFLSDIANRIGISSEEQKANIIKYSRRGRKKKIKN